MNNHHHQRHAFLLPASFKFHVWLSLTLSQVAEIPGDPATASLRSAVRKSISETRCAHTSPAASHHGWVLCLYNTCWHLRCAKVLAHRLPGYLRQERHGLLISGSGQGCVTCVGPKAIMTAPRGTQGISSPSSGHLRQYLHLYAVLALLLHAAQQR